VDDVSDGLEDEAAGDGIGEEEDQVGEEEDEPGQVVGKLMRLEKNPPLLPPWLDAAFSAVLAEAKQRDSSGLPCLYAGHGTFWLPQKSTYFI
jgi:hypothetical protein